MSSAAITDDGFTLSQHEHECNILKFIDQDDVFTMHICPTTSFTLLHIFRQLLRLQQDESIQARCLIGTHYHSLGNE